MRFGQVFLVFLLVIGCLELHAQTPQRIKILQNNGYTAIPFDDGKTIITKIVFEGFDAISEQNEEKSNELLYEADALFILKNNRANINIGDEFYGYKIAKSVKVIREWLSGKGYNRAEVTAFGEKLPKNQMKLVFAINRGDLARVSEIRFEGNKNITNGDLIAAFEECSGDSWKIFDKRRYEYYLKQCALRFVFSKGYLRAKIGAPRLEFFSGGYVVKVEVQEGSKFRYGDIKIQGSKAFTEKEILGFVGLKTGEIANGKILQDLFYERLKRIYADKGFILYDAEFEPKFIDSQKDVEDSRVDLLVMIDEGRQFKLGKIEFAGVEKEKAEELRRFFFLEYGEIFNQTKIEEGIKKINELKEFYQIEFEGSDVEIRTKQNTEGKIVAEKDGVILREKSEETEKTDKVNLVIRLKKIQK